MALQDAERRRDALIGTALGAWNKRALRLQSEREEARTLMDEMIAESQMRERQERERMRAAAPWQMALSGAGTGAAIGSAVAPGLGTAIGAGVGALGGALLGHHPLTPWAGLPLTSAWRVRRRRCTRGSRPNGIFMRTWLGGGARRHH